MCRQNILLDAMEMKQVQGKRYQALVMIYAKCLGTVCASNANKNYYMIGADSGEGTDSMSVKHLWVLGQRDELASKITLSMMT